MAIDGTLDIPDSIRAASSLVMARQEAAWAMDAAARALGVEPAALGRAAYRSFRAGHMDAGLPSAMAISALFRGWQRACEHMTMHVRNDVAVEAAVAERSAGWARSAAAVTAPQPGEGPGGLARRALRAPWP
jgi:hypothetical protein